MVFGKKLLLSWGLLNKDLIALNACVQGKCYAIQLTVLGIPEWEQLLDIIHHLAWFEVLIRPRGRKQKLALGSIICINSSRFVIKTEKVQFLSNSRRTL